MTLSYSWSGQSRPFNAGQMKISRFESMAHRRMGTVTPQVCLPPLLMGEEMELCAIMEPET